jgi:hypothetical protein
MKFKKIKNIFTHFNPIYKSKLKTPKINPKHQTLGGTFKRQTLKTLTPIPKH